MHEEFLTWYKRITKFKGSNYIAPHKPLTILFALTKVLKNERWVDYEKDREQLEFLIQNNTNKKVDCLYPLWRLANDNKEIEIWWREPNNLVEDKSGNIKKSEACSRHFRAGFSDSMYSYLQSHKEVTQILINEILCDNFPETIIEDNLNYLGLADIPLNVVSQKYDFQLQRYKRDPNFRPQVMELYDSRCCFCSLRISLHYRPLPMEAAHIKWKSEGGECSVYNGLSLCPTHHLTFDRGVWTLNEAYEIELSPRVLLDKRSDVFFSPFVGKPIMNAILDHSKLPKIENLNWHRENIFKV